MFTTLYCYGYSPGTVENVNFISYGTFVMGNRFATYSHVREHDKMKGYDHGPALDFCSILCLRLY